MRMRFCFLLLCVLALPGLAAAQSDFLSLTNSNQLVLAPAYPQPGDTVSVSLDDYGNGVVGAGITWRYNGAEIANSKNRRSVDVIAGEAGTNATIQAVLSLPSGGTRVVEADINPIYLDVIVEPQTRVPDWYNGRGLPSIGSLINATALVNDGSFVDPAGLVYTWRVNNQVIEAGPVRGRNAMSFETPRGSAFVLSVSVSRVSGEILGSLSKEIRSVSPSVTFYEQHALYGTQSSPITSATPLVSNAVTLIAEPFNLDTRVYNNPDVATWELNGFETDNGTQNPYEITLQRSGIGGRTGVTFHVRSLQEVLQGGKATINLTF